MKCVSRSFSTIVLIFSFSAVFSGNLLADNLIENAGFEDGISAFTTSYVTGVGGNVLVPEGTYAVGSNPNVYRSDGAFSGVIAQSGAGTNFFMANGSTSTLATVWQTSSLIQVTEPNTAYRFEAHVTSLVDVNQFSASPLLSFELGDGTNWIDMGSTVEFPNDTPKGNWDLFYIDGNFNTAGNYYLRLKNDQGAAGGNDFGIDTIYFGLSAESPSVGEHPVDNPQTFETGGLQEVPNVDLQKGFYTLTELQNNQVGRTFEGGTLQIDSNGQTVAGDFIVLPSNGTIDTNTYNFTISGDIIGDGGLTKNGLGDLLLTGTNTYSGGTIVSAGTLTGNTTSLQGGILNNSAVVFDQAGDGTYAGSMSGNGTLTKTGAGNLTLTSANTYSGGTIVSAGTLTGNTTSLQGGILNNSAVVFDQAGDGIYSAVMSGTGALTKTGAGMLTLSGANTHVGDIIIEAGILNLSGSVGGGVLVNSGSLVGNGMIGSALTVAPGGTVSPGNSIGVIIVNGDYVLNGTYDAEVSKTAGGVLLSDLINVSGSATLSAGSQITITELPAGGTILNGDAFRVISTGNGVTDNGTAVTSQSAFLDFAGLTVGNDYYVLATRTSDFTSQAVGKNNIQVAQVLDASSTIAKGDFATVMNSLLMLSVSQFNYAARQLNARTYLVQQQVVFRNAQRQAEDLADYLYRRRKAGSFIPFGSLNQDAMIASTDNDPTVLSQAIALQEEQDKEAGRSLRFFVKPFSAIYNEDTTTNRLGFCSVAYGAQLGVDREFVPGLVLGMFTSVSETQVGYDQHRGNGNVFTVRVGPYATIYKNKLSLDVWGSYGFHRNEVERNIAFGAIMRNPHSAYNAHDGSIYMGLQYDLDLFGFTLSPMASLQYICMRQDEAKESRGGSINLRTSGNTAHSLRSRLGGRLSKGFDALGTNWTTEVSAGWAYEHIDDQGIIASFDGTTGPFTTTTGGLGSTVYAGAAVGMEIKPDVNVTARYTSEFSNRVCDHRFGLEFVFKF